MCACVEPLGLGVVDFFVRAARIRLSRPQKVIRLVMMITIMEVVIGTCGCK